MLQELIDVLITTLWMILGIAVIFGIFLAVSGIVYLIWNFIHSKQNEIRGYHACNRRDTIGGDRTLVAERDRLQAAVSANFILL